MRRAHELESAVNIHRRKGSWTLTEALPEFLALNTFCPFLGEGSPTKKILQKKGTLILTSLLEDLAAPSAIRCALLLSADSLRPQELHLTSKWLEAFAIGGAGYGFCGFIPVEYQSLPKLTKSLLKRQETWGKSTKSAPKLFS